MCISAPASFAAGTILTISSVFAIRHSVPPRMKPFAAIPFIFAIQQFTEGFVWLSLDTTEYINLRIPSVFVFLIFAQVVWPIYVPLSVLYMENDKKKKPYLYGLTLIGGLFSSWLLYNLIAHPSEVSIYKSHLLYEMKYPLKLALPGSIAYFAATVIPLFISSVYRCRLLAMIILGSFVMSKLYFSETLISVWCMMAAIASISIYYIIYSNVKNPERLQSR